MIAVSSGNIKAVQFAIDFNKKLPFAFDFNL